MLELAVQYLVLETIQISKKSNDRQTNKSVLVKFYWIIPFCFLNIGLELDKW